MLGQAIWTAFFAGLAGLAAGSFLAAANRRGAAGRGVGARRWISRASPALAVSLAYVVGHVLLQGWPALPPSQADGWLAWIAMAAAASACAEAALGEDSWIRWCVRAPLCIAMPLSTLWPLASSSWTLAEGWAWIAGLGLVTAALLGSVEAWCRTRPGDLAAVGFVLAAGGASPALLFSSGARLGSLAAMWTGGLAGTAIALRFLPGIPLECAAGPVTLLFVGLVLNGHFYSSLPGAAAALLALALALPGLSALALKGRAGSRVQAWLGPLLALSALVAAAVLSWTPMGE